MKNLKIKLFFLFQKIVSIENIELSTNQLITTKKIFKPLVNAKCKPLNSLRFLTCFFIFILGIESCIFANSDTDLNTSTKKIDQIMREYVKNDQFMGSILVAEKGKIIFKKSYGFVDIEKNIPHTTSTVYPFGFEFTSQIMDHLEHVGLMHRDDSLAKYIPDYPSGEIIKIKHLLDNSSGIVCIYNDLPFNPKTMNLDRPVTHQSLINQFKDKPLQFDPGTSYSYSVSNHILFCYIIGKISGMTYEEYIKTNFLNKSNLENYSLHWKDTPKFAYKGYGKSSKSDHFSSILAPHISYLQAVGLFYASIENIYQIKRSFIKTENSKKNYLLESGQNWFGNKLFSLINPLADIEIIMCGNYDDIPFNKISTEILNSSGNSFSNSVKNKIIKLKKKQIEKFLGKYLLYDNYYMSIKYDDNKLYMIVDNTNGSISSIDLYPISTSQLVFETGDLNFSNEKNKTYKKVDAYFNNRIYNCIRVNSPEHKSYKYKKPKKTDDNWQVAKANREGINIGKLEKMNELIINNDYKNIHSVLIIKNGKLVFEEYFNGFDSVRKQDLRSVSKTIASILIGIAIDKKYIKSVNELVYPFFKEYEPELGWDDEFKKVTIEMLLNMTSGVCCDDWEENFKCLHETLASKDWVNSVISRGMAHPANQFYAYSGTSLILLGEIIAKTSKMKLVNFAKKYLFDPLDIKDVKWKYINYDVVYFMLHMIPRDMAKIGYMFLNNGKWMGKSILSEKWIQESIIKLDQTEPSWEQYGFHHHYLWWYLDEIIDGTHIKGYYASGNGGQKIMVIPSLEMVIVVTGGNYNSKLSKHSMAIMTEHIIQNVLETKYN